MAHFIGSVEGRRGKASRLGSAASGIKTVAASWQGAVQVDLHHDEASCQDRVTVRLIPWHGAGVSRVLYEGPVSGAVEKDQPLSGAR